MTAREPRHPSLLLVAALGVVYGDIGTSPLYALREGLTGEHGAGVGQDAVFGVLSMMFWVVTLVVSLKYMLLVLAADNDGEGGDLALLALVLRQLPAGGRLRRAAIIAGLISAAMFYGDSAITPAISVLSAVEGLRVVSSLLDAVVLPTTLAVLVLLFAFQKHGTARVGGIFGPVMVVWFATIAVLGLVQIVQTPAVLRALEPLYALRFAIANPALTFTVLAAVFLAITGAEALYADVGHFGKRPVRIAWFWIAMPCLLLNYFGQGALVLRDPANAMNPFFLLAPTALQLPLVLLATAATVIASQAVISGAFSMTGQAIKLGYLPRMAIQYTSQTVAGQIYVPLANWLLMVVVLLLVIGFRESSSLAAAYGIAVSVSMAITTLGVLVVARLGWDWSMARLVIVFVPLLIVDWLFVAANTAKIPHGGWFPLVFGALLFLLFSTWKQGRTATNEKMRRAGIELAPFLKSLAIYPPQRVDGTAVFMTSEPGLVPNALLHNLKHNRVLHERVIFLTAISRNVPHVEPDDMAEVAELGDGCYTIKVRLGFQDPYDVAFIATVLEKHHDFDLNMQETSFFLSRQSVMLAREGAMAPWRRRLFGWMLRNAQPASDFFRIPPNRVIEIGAQVAI